MSRNPVQIDHVVCGKSHPLVLIAGPCVIESLAVTLQTAETLAEICQTLKVPLIFKASFDKANRTSLDSYRGMGLVRAWKCWERYASDWAWP